MNYVIDAATVMIEILYTGIFLKGLFGNYEKKRLYILLSYLSFGIVMIMLNQFAIPILNVTYLFIGIFLLAKLLFNVKWLSAVYSALLMCVINVVVDIACSGILFVFGVHMTTLMQVSNERVFLIVLAKLVQTFCILLVVKLAQARKSEDSLVSAVPLFLCQVFSIFIGYIMYLGAIESGQNLPLSFLIAAVGLLYINIIIYLYVERIKKISEIKRQNELAEQLFNSKLDYFNQVKEDQEQTRSLWHDIKKYMNTMQELIRMDDLTDAKACIDQVGMLFENTGTIVDVGNTVVSAVLNHSVQKARRQNIAIDIDVRVREEMSISAADLSVIIGNTFDNAIEAVTPLSDDHRKISVQLIQKNNILFYEITNPIVTTDTPKKRDKVLHGYGLKNVRRCIDKYKGNLLVNAAEGWYKVSATIAVS